jgi:predicted outer membrane repeat protein
MMTITGSTISDNYTDLPGHFGGDGGGIENDGTMTIQDSTISGNRAVGAGFAGGYGGGIYGNNTTITNSTITANSAHFGGGVAGGGNIAHTTFSNNSASQDGGALYLTSPLELGNTILKAGASGVNIFNHNGSLITHGYNVCSDNGSGFLNGPGDQINTDPMLGPLQDNGGPTFTHALLPGSPAIDAGDPNFTPPPDYDQRGPGFVRVFNGRIDAGSFELQPTPSPTPTLTPTATFTPTPTATATATPTAAFTPTPSGPPCVAVGSQPACNSTVFTQLTDFFIYIAGFVDSLPPPSVFTVNGIPADTVSGGGSTLEFHFNASPVIPGQNTMDIPRGAFTCSNNGTPFEGFHCTFTYQPSTPTPTPRPSPTPRPASTPRPRPSPAPRP